ncbi:MAG TPA: arginine deiminase-related protein [Pyrinomonadaceae bacterium]|nr:arginine deiminase-related protein [Pyrinomonadaceae bacterium]
MSSFTRAIVRPPGVNFSAGLTTVNLGTPVYDLALKQHAEYCEALRSCGLRVTSLAVDEQYPDSTFVEDTAILTKRCAIITRPGAETRRGEITSIERELATSFKEIRSIHEPGTLDGGDICEVDEHFFIAISARTNEAGARQFAEILAEFGFTSAVIDVRPVKSILHLKSGLAHLGGKQLVVIDELAECDQLSRYELIRVKPDEAYATNCIRINGSVLIAAGFPSFAETLSAHGYETIAVEMSEFQKMDGGLSCLSLRF